MAHNIHFNNITNKHSFASKKEIAWHGLGKVVDAMTSKEAIVLGGLDFNVEKRPLYVGQKIVDTTEVPQHELILRTIKGKDNKEYQNLVKFPNQYAMVRTDNGLPLGIVGERYFPIQNIEAFDFIDSIIGEGTADYETVGALGNGETVFITCKLREELIINKDLIDKYLLISMSHDGSSSITVMFTPIRVVCNNTLSAALNVKAKDKVIIKHTKNAKERLELSKKVLGIVDQDTLNYQNLFKELYKREISDDVAKVVIERSLGLIRDIKGNLSTKADNINESAWLYYNQGVGQEEIVGTAWGVYNAITGFYQNAKSFKDSEAKFKAIYSSRGTVTRTNTIKQLLAV